MVTPRKWRVPKLANSESNAGRYSRKFTVVRSPYIIFPMSSPRYPMHLPVNGVPFLRPWFFHYGIRAFPSMFRWSPSFFSNPHCTCNAEVYFKILLRPSIILKIESELTTDAFFWRRGRSSLPLTFCCTFPMAFSRFLVLFPRFFRSFLSRVCFYCVIPCSLCVPSFYVYPKPKPCLTINLSRHSMLAKIKL